MERSLKRVPGDPLEKLTAAQREAVTHVDGPCLCLAGPGSGKTTVITGRTRYLIEQCQANPLGILVITFTRAAAREMEKRFAQAMGGRHVPVTFGTFHSVFFWILKQAYRYTAANILKEDQKYQILREIIDGQKLEIDDESEFLSGIASEISMIKNDRIALEHYYSKNCPEEAFRSIYKSYQERIAGAGLLDFDDMLVYCYELLTGRPDILAGWQKRFRYILIDEFQDINQLQYDIIRLLAAPENNLFIVGDDDQSIYRFRGARPEIMLNFRKDYPDAKVVLLAENFRSTENIIRAAGKVIVCNSARYQKSIRGVRERGDRIEVHGFANPPQQNTFVVKKLQEYLVQGYHYRDAAVLFRTNTAGRPLVEKFMEYNIPFSMRDALPNIYEHWISRNVLSYIRMAVGNRERKEFLQIMNRPKRYISREALDEPVVSFDRLRDFYREKDWMVDRIDRLEYDLWVMGKMAPYAAVNYIRKGIGYEDYLTEYAQYRKIKPEELHEVLNELQESARRFSTYEEWFDHMDEYAEALKEQAKEQKSQEDAVSFMTLHSAKGLEFPIVFIVDVNEGTIPHRKAVLDADLQEERRMFYVGMTRAKEHLHLYYVKEKYGKPQEVSRFIQELRR